MNDESHQYEYQEDHQEEEEHSQLGLSMDHHEVSPNGQQLTFEDVKMGDGLGRTSSSDEPSEEAS